MALTPEVAGKLLSDYPLYSRTCLKIRTKQARIVPFEPNHGQLLVHSKITQQRRQEGRVRVLILKARQLGMSTYVAGRFFRRVTLTPSQRAMVLADKKTRAQDLFGIYERFTKNLPAGMLPNTDGKARGRHLIFDSKKEQGLGSELVVETAGDINAGRAGTTQLLHLSELAFWPEALDTWISLMQSVPDSDSEVIVESTANGVGGLFYELWTEAEAGLNGFLPIFLPWWIHDEYAIDVTDAERKDIYESLDPVEREALDVGFELEGEMHRLSAEQLAWRRSAIRDKLQGDARLFRQEYPSTAREAFLTSGAGFFDEEKLKLYELSSKKPILRGNVFFAGGGVLVAPAERGYFRMWERPSRLGRYVIFADTASGKVVAEHGSTLADPDAERGGRDFSSAHVYETDTRRFVATLHGRMAPEIFAEQVEALGYFYSSPGREGDGTGRRPAYLGVERNHSSGETVLKVLKDEKRYPNLHYDRTINRRSNQVTMELGWRTTTTSRPILFDTLAAAIRIESVALPDADTISKMFTFVRGDDGSPRAQKGSHDDRVVSAAGCLQMAKWAPPPASPAPEPVQVADTPTGWAPY